jgi:hypothetical protein
LRGIAPNLLSIAAEGDGAEKKEEKDQMFHRPAIRGDGQYDGLAASMNDGAVLFLDACSKA